MSLKNRYDNVIIRNNQSLGLSSCALDYLLDLEEELARLKVVAYCPYDKKCGKLYDCTKKEYEDMCNANMKLSLENQQLKEKLNKYEDPEDLTLMFMYCDEKTKDKIKNLEKQLEEINKMIEKCGFVNIEQVMLNYCGLLSQQKEFIKYLEDEISKWHNNYDSYNYEYEIEEPTAEELANKILQKYKEIISDKDASNSRKVCKEIEWLETNLNKNGVYRFEMNGPLIDWFHKKSGNHLGTFYVDMIRKMLEKEGGDNK